MATDSYLQERTQLAIKTTARLFGGRLDPKRQLADLPNVVYAEVDAPEYLRNGLGRMVVKTLRYEFTDIGQFGCEGLSIGANSTRMHMIYEDMNPVVYGTYTQVTERRQEVCQALMRCGFTSTEMMAVGVLRARELEIDPGSDASVKRLVAYLDMYNQRASWMESHWIEVLMANHEAENGHALPFDWPAKE
jgi:hypothetical protein